MIKTVFAKISELNMSAFMYSCNVQTHSLTHAYIINFIKMFIQSVNCNCQKLSPSRDPADSLRCSTSLLQLVSSMMVFSTAYKT